MTYSYRRLVLNPLVVLLMLVAMIFATAADAAACGSEVAPGDAAAWIAADEGPATSDVDGDQGDPEVPADQHGVCGHGHCHHGASFAGGIHKEQVPLASLILAAPPVAASVSDVSTRLKRPPRA